MTVTDIVFDLGRVLIDFQYRELLTFLDAHGAQYQSIDDLLDQMQLYAYETGRMTDEEFVDNLNRLLREPIHPEAIRRMWVDIFSPIPDMLDLAHDLATRHGVYILSNASSLHWEYLRAEFQIDAIGHGQLASFQAGVRKPDPGIYHTAETQFGLTPAHTVFIDDLPENAAGARACGWQAIHHRSPTNTRAALRELGVTVGEH
jgi:putative hydrolase of the HAD superfamily